jgi:hypothetical protein
MEWGIQAVCFTAAKRKLSNPTKQKNPTMPK